MTYYEAALQVLRSVQRPLTTREITAQAVERGLIAPDGKTPEATMSAKLYMALRNDSELVKLEEPGKKRARPGTVRWTLRHSPTTDQRKRKPTDSLSSRCRSEVVEALPGGNASSCHAYV